MSIKTDRAKLDEKIFNSIFIDYQSEITNYWVWNSINQKIIWSLFVEMFESWKDSKLLSILGFKWQWEYQINLVISDDDNEILELSFSVKVSLNTSITFSHYLIASEHEDVIIISRIDDLDKCLNQNEENNRDLFENSNAEESEIISSQSESEDEACQDHQFDSERRAFSSLKNCDEIIKQKKFSQALNDDSELTMSVLVSQNIIIASCKWDWSSKQVNKMLSLLLTIKLTVKSVKQSKCERALSKQSYNN